MGDESAMKTKVINTVWMKLESEPRRLILQKLKNQFPWRRGSSDPCTPSLLSFNPCSPAQTAGQAERGGERASKLETSFVCIHFHCNNVSTLRRRQNQSGNKQTVRYVHLACALAHTLNVHILDTICLRRRRRRRTRTRRPSRNKPRRSPSSKPICSSCCRPRRSC